MSVSNQPSSSKAKLVSHEQKRRVRERHYRRRFCWKITGREIHGRCFLRKWRDWATRMFARGADLVVRRDSSGARKPAARQPAGQRRRALATDSATPPSQAGQRSECPMNISLLNHARLLPGRGASKAVSRSACHRTTRRLQRFRGWHVCAPCAGFASLRLCGLARGPSRQSCKSCESCQKLRTGFLGFVG